MNYRTARSFAGAFSISAIAVLAAGTARAQAQEAPAPAGANEDSTPIIVTGSRIVSPEAGAANPVVSLSAERLQESGTTNVTEYLKTLPALVGSSGGYDNSGSRAGIGYTGLNLLNLRNLGLDRTLVLVDGRRHVGSVDGLQAVDVNTIPQDLIERVEVLTGGASAIYGADAVSGVVNFIMKRDFEGIAGRAQAGISSRGDSGQRLITLTAGHNFAGDRGNITLAWEHGEEDRLDVRQRGYLSGSARIGFYKNPADTEAGTDSNNDGIPDNIPLDDIRFFDTARQGGIDVNFDGFPDFFGANAAPYDPGTFIPDFFQRGGSGTLASDYGNDLLPQVKRDVVNAIAHFTVSDAFELYAEAKYAKTKSFSLSQPTFDYYLLIPEDNPYIPETLRPLIAEIGIGGVLVNRDNFDFGQRGEDITRETIRTVVGAKGNLTPHLKYDVSDVYGQTDVTNHYIANILTDRYYAAIDAVQGPNGITCRVNIDPEWTPTQPFNYTRSQIPPTTFAPGDCIPLNLFGEGVNSKAAIDWIATDTTDRTRVIQHVASAAISGDSGGFFQLPGGPIGFALGAEYRKEISRFVADPLAQQGLTFGNSLGNSSGSFDVKEAYAEVSLPLLADVPFAHRLSIGGAIRVSDYSSIGSTTAWKVDGNWAPVPDIAFRGTYSVAVRAPNISELYGAPGQTFNFIDDPCNIGNQLDGTQFRQSNCEALLTALGADPATFTDTRSSNLPGLLGSNPDVKEERAKTWTAGVVLRPSFIPRLVVTADWYDIKIENAIFTADAQDLAELCVDQQTLDNQYCALITRDNGGETAGFVNGFTLKPFNVAAYRTAGLDVTLDYTIPTDSAGTFRAHVVANYLNKLTYIPIPGAPVVNDAYTGGGDQTISPKYQVTADLGWKKGAFSLNWRMTYFSKTFRYSQKEMAANPDIVAPQYLEYKAKFVNDLYLAADVTDQFEIYGGMDNVFDVKPDFGSQVFPVSAVGRFFYVGAKVKLGKVFR